MRGDKLSMNSKIDVGLVFAIPLAERSFGFGQLIAWQRPIFYMAGYDLRSESPHVDEREIRNARPVLFGKLLRYIDPEWALATNYAIGFAECAVPLFQSEGRRQVLRRNVGPATAARSNHRGMREPAISDE